MATIERIQITLEPHHYNDTPVRVLKMRIDVDGQVHFVERHLSPDDLVPYFDEYFDIMRDTLKKALRKSAAEADEAWESLAKGSVEHEPDQTYGACE